MGYIYPVIAALAEVAGTSFLSATEGFTRLGPTAFVLVAYGLAFWMLSLSMKTMAGVVVYALWCGAGIALIALIALIGWFLLKQPLDLPALIGIGLILAGVVVIHLFSDAVRQGYHVVPSPAPSMRAVIGNGPQRAQRSQREMDLRPRFFTITRHLELKKPCLLYACSVSSVSFDSLRSPFRASFGGLSRFARLWSIILFP